jgi:hypothetical protein
MSILPKKLFLPIKSKQDADKLIAYLSNVKPKERYSFGDLEIALRVLIT